MKRSFPAQAVLVLLSLATPALPGGCARHAAPGAADPATPATGRTVLGGEMQYMADAVRYFECGSGRSYPIAMEADFVAMERAYLGAVSAPGAKLYVTFEGSIVPRPKMEGGGEEPAVVVTRFIHAWPDEACERAMADASLTNTYWRIVRLGVDAVMPAQGVREPHLVLRAEDGGTGYEATVGCNQLAGGCTVSGDTIRFGPAATTLMACPPLMDEMERKLGAALASAQRWIIKAHTLELYDGDGAPVALFQAVYF